MLILHLNILYAFNESSDNILKFDIVMISHTHTHRNYYISNN